MSNQDNVSELVQLINIKEGILGEKNFNTKMSALLRQAAAESIVLLENEGVLPFFVYNLNFRGNHGIFAYKNSAGEASANTKNYRT